MLVNLITVLFSTCFHYRYAASLILTLIVPGVTQVTIGIGQRRVRLSNDLVLLVFGRSLVTGGPSIYLVVSMSSEFNVNIFSRHYFYLLLYQNCLAISDRVTVGFYFSLAVLGTIGDKFGFINLRRYHSKFEFHDVFKQDKCPRLKEF